MPKASSLRRDLVIDEKLPCILKEVKAVVFDLDGTLCDSIPTILNCTRKTFLQEGLTPPLDEDVLKTIGLELSEGITSLLPDGEKHRGLEVTAHYREIFINTPEFVKDYIFPGVFELLENLRKHGLKIAYASGRSKTGILRTLDATFLGDFCDAIAAGNEVPSKPNPLMMFKVCERLNLNPNECLGVGDASLDILMFKNAKSYSLGVQTGVLCGDVLSSLKPDALLPKVSMLDTYLD